MNENQAPFLGLLGQLPARLTAEQAAWVVTCQPYDIRALVGARFLKPLGNLPPNGVKSFATADLLEKLEDRSWLTKVTNTINQHWPAQCPQKKPVLAARSTLCAVMTG